MVPNSSRTGPKLDNTNLLHSLPQVKLFKLFIMMILLLKWLSRPTSMLFKEAHHDHSGQYLMGSSIDTFKILVVIWEEHLWRGLAIYGLKCPEIAFSG